MKQSLFRARAEKVRELLISGASNSEILKKYPSISKTALSRQRKIAGLNPLKRGRKFGIIAESTRLRLKKVIELQSKGFSLTKIASIVGVSRQCLDQQINPEQHRARCAIRHALDYGKMTRPKKCDKCSKRSFVEAHHSDYSKPLEVIWLCLKCHGLNRKISFAISRLNRYLSEYGLSPVVVKF